MNGQGGPAPKRCGSRGASSMVWGLLLALCASGWATSAQAADAQLRLRFAWGGGARRAWESTVSVENGSLSDLVSLGIEADEPGSMWIDDAGQARVWQRSGRAYDAFDLTVRAADSNARLTVTMHAQSRDIPAFSQTFTISELRQGSHGGALDQQGNRFVVKRAPGDMLPLLELDREALIYQPSERLSLFFGPQLQHLPAGTTVRMRAELLASAERRVVWSQDYDLRVPGESEPALAEQVQTTLPAEEGVYELHLTVSERGLRQRLVPAVLATTIAERRLQLVVLSHVSKPQSARTDKDWQLLSEMDSANPAWWQRSLALPSLKRLPGWPQGPLRNGLVQPWKHDLGAFTRLEVATQQPGGSWEALPLAIDQTGSPHLLEIEFPADAAPNLGVSILEPNAAGAVLPIGVDSGAYGEASEGPAGKVLRKHRVLFWPRTRNPLVLLTQLNPNLPAGFGKLRVYQRGDRLSRVTPIPGGGAQRLVAGYMDRPLFPENFSAPEIVDSSLGQTVDDWETFYQGGRRLTDYMRHVGQNGLMLSVLADGSTIYPSQLLAPSPRYDTGMIGSEGRDPVRKDVLELLFRLFDREQLSLVPTLHFDATLPELEDALRRGGPESVGIAWIGADGASWLERHNPTRELAPYYNPLHERTQLAMLAVFHELVGRYASHPSFAGVGIALSSEGYTQLLGPEWGLDDDTIAQFERDMQTRVVTQPGEDRRAKQIHYLLGEGRAAWLQWRAQRLATLYRRMNDTLQSQRPGAKLYLAPTGVLDSEAARGKLRPALPQHAKVEEALLEVGLAPALFETQPGIVFLRPHRSQPAGGLGQNAIDIQIREAISLHQRLSLNPASGTLFYHPPQRTRLESFDRQSPFGADKTYTLLISQPAPVGELNRRRFVRSLALADNVALFDGGWLLPLGQEDAVQRLWTAFSQLPPEKFETSRFSRQPVVIRVHSSRSASHVYLVNDSPWPVKARVRLNAAPSCQIIQLHEMGPSQTLPQDATGSYWDVELRGYDFAAARFNQPDLRVLSADMLLPPEVEQQLDQEIQELGARAAALESQLPLELLENSGFELPLTAGGVSGWKVAQPEGTTLAVLRENPRAGAASLRWGSTRAVASLQSNLFETPGSGRLAVAVWLRVEDAARQPILRLAVEDANDGQAYYRFAQLGNGTVPLKTEWTQYIFPVEDLPLAGLPKMRVRFDLMGPGAVWIDDVQLFHLKFSQNERIELSKILVTARGALRNGELADCLHMLEGYWPQFLQRFVPDEAVSTTRPARAEVAGVKTATAPLPASKPADPGAIDKLKQYVPKFLRF